MGLATQWSTLDAFYPFRKARIAPRWNVCARGSMAWARTRSGVVDTLRTSAVRVEEGRTQMHTLSRLNYSLIHVLARRVRHVSRGLRLGAGGE